MNKLAVKRTKQRSAGKPDIEMGKRIRLRRVEQRISQAELGDLKQSPRARNRSAPTGRAVTCRRARRRVDRAAKAPACGRRGRGRLVPRQAPSAVTTCLEPRPQAARCLSTNRISAA